MKIVVIEDNKGDIHLIKEALNQTRREINLNIITNGLDAVAYISSQEPKPDLIILDINLPHIDGFRVLETIKKSDYNEVPIAVFTSSDSEKDKKKALSMGASVFSTKPFEAGDYFNTVLSFLSAAGG